MRDSDIRVASFDALLLIGLDSYVIGFLLLIGLNLFYFVRIPSSYLISCLCPLIMVNARNKSERMRRETKRVIVSCLSFILTCARSGALTMLSLVDFPDFHLMVVSPSFVATYWRPRWYLVVGADLFCRRQWAINSRRTPTIFFIIPSIWGKTADRVSSEWWILD